MNCPKCKSTGEPTTDSGEVFFCNHPVCDVLTFRNDGGVICLIES